VVASSASRRQTLFSRLDTPSTRAGVPQVPTLGPGIPQTPVLPETNLPYATKVPCHPFVGSLTNGWETSTLNRSVHKERVPQVPTLGPGIPQTPVLPETNLPYATKVPCHPFVGSLTNGWETSTLNRPVHKERVPQVPTLGPGIPQTPVLPEINLPYPTKAPRPINSSAI
jgi:hypothetical protein